jgi:hypothetical protein
MVAFKAAIDLNEQGIANFLAERQDQHKKWSWQLRASLAPEAEDQNEAEMEKSMTEEIAPQAEEVAPAAPEAVEPAEAIEPAADEPQVEAVEPAAEEYREVSDADVEEVRASADSNRRALERGEPVAQAVVAPVEAPAEPEAVEPPADAAVIDAVVEEPAVEAAPEGLGEEPVIEGEEVSEKSADVDLLEIVALAKSALDAAVASQQEVDALKIQVTELSEAKAKVEGDLENAHNIINRLSVEGVGRKTVSKQTDEVKGSDARWLHPYIQGVLDAQE